MKKIIALLAACLVPLCAFAGCGNTAPEPTPPPEDNVVQQTLGSFSDEREAVMAARASEVVVVKEKLFIAQMNDMYYNREDYLGKTIQYEGLFDTYTVPETGVTYRSVIRYGPGCCGIDANPGFEVQWDQPYPEENDWCEAVGTLKEYDEDGNKYLRLDLSSLKVLPVRGLETVTQ